MSLSTSEKMVKVNSNWEDYQDANPTWAFLHRAGLDNCDIELCYNDVSRILKLDPASRNKEEIKETLWNCGLAKNPLDRVIGVLFP